MARIQIMPLPTETQASFSHTPFVIVIDDAEYAVDFTAEAIEELKHVTGALGVLIVNQTLDVGTPLELPEEDKAALLAQIKRA